MDTQETPVNSCFWHRSFGLLATANFFLTISVYMLVPSLSEWLLEHFSHFQVGLIMGSYGLGLFLLGPYCSFLVQHFRRNQVCVFAIFLMALLTSLIYFCKENYSDWQVDVFVLVIIRLLYGAAFGVAQMVLCSTLVIDSCESCHRTRANYILSWFGRVGVAAGPLLVLLLGRWLELDIFLLIALVTCCSLLLIMMVRFPFRAPESTKLRASLDRFFLTESWPLFVNMVLITILVGMMLALVHSLIFYVMMMCGFLLAIIIEQWLLSCKVRCGILVGMAMVFVSLLSMWSGHLWLNIYIVPLCFGVGIGIISSGFLLSFVRLSDHCQRGTSQSTFFLSWELGVSAGLFGGYAFLVPGNHRAVSSWIEGNQILSIPTSSIVFAVVCLLAAILFYVFFTYPWYLRHRNR